jgi:hypothetical protein
MVCLFQSRLNQDLDCGKKMMHEQDNQARNAQEWHEHDYPFQDDKTEASERDAAADIVFILEACMLLLFHLVVCCFC